MPLEPKDFFEVLALKQDEIDTPEKLKEAIDEKFEKIKKDSDGALVGSSIVSIKRNLKKAGIDLTEADTTGKKLSVIIEENFSKAIDGFTSQIETLKAEGGKGADEKVKTLETELDKFKKLYSEEKTAREGALNDFNVFKTQTETEKKTFARDAKVKEYREKAKFASNVDDLKKRGFWSKFDDNYNADFDDSGELIPTDKKGNRIPHPKVSNTFLKYDELIEHEMIKEKVNELNPHGNNQQQTQKKVEVKKEVSTEGPQKPERRIAAKIETGIVSEKR